MVLTPKDDHEPIKTSSGSWFRRSSFSILAIAILATVSYLASGSGLISPLWPTDPEIRPSGSFSGNVSDIVFEVSNASALFGIEDAELICGVDQAIFEDSSGRVIGSAGFAFVTEKTFIPPRGRIGHKCDAFRSIQIGPGGAVSMRSIVSAAPAGFSGPLKVRKICLWFGLNYRAFGAERHFRSEIFQWPASHDNPSWIEVSIVADARATGIGVIECSNRVRVPYNLFNGPGAAILVRQ
jgi:hypothetical protein